MRQYIEVRGFRIAVHAKTLAQAKWYRDNYALRSNYDLTIFAAETTLEDYRRSETFQRHKRQKIADTRRACFRLVS